MARSKNWHVVIQCIKDEYEAKRLNAMPKWLRLKELKKKEQKKPSPPQQ